MSLKNSEYDAVMRRYDEIRENNQHLLDRRTEEIYRAIPEIEKTDDESVSNSMCAARARIADPGADISAYLTEMKKAAARKARLLTENGYPADYLEMHYDCPKCRDTGYTEGRRCTCFTRIAAEVIYGETAPDITQAIDENAVFERFSFTVYSDKMIDETTGKTPRETARGAFSAAKELTEKIGRPGANLYIYGNTGVGKTFLAHCAANEAAARGASVLCFSSADFFEVLALSLREKDNSDTGKRLIETCDLLIIDDLGTELANTFTASALFRIINTRIMRNRSTIISSNLSLKDLSTKYSERIFSRITSEYRIIRLTGNDIRIEKKLNSTGGQT